MRGYVYVLSNPAMTGLLKVGMTAESPEARIRQLSSTGLPVQFVLEAAFLVNDAAQVEQDTHRDLAAFRHASNREFFNATLSDELAKLLPIVLADLGREPAPPKLPVRRPHALSSGEVSVLQVLVTLAGSFGLTNFRIRDYCGGEALDIEVALANLLERKLVARRHVHDSNGPTWVATPKAVKLLSDHDLIDDWMRKNSGA